MVLWDKPLYATEVLCYNSFDMEYVGNNNIRLPLIGLGTYSIHGKQLDNLLTEAISLGYTLFDTATKYGNEQDFKGVLQSKRDLIVQSKIHSDALRGRMRFLYLDKKSIKKSLLLSSKKISRTPDIYFLHTPFVGFEKHFRDLLELREKGAIKAIGICNISLEQLQNLIKTEKNKPDIIQVEIHPYHNSKALVEYCHEQGILVEARSPFAHGDALPEWENNNELIKIAHCYGKSVPQVILRWIIQQGVVAIVKTTNPKHLRDDLDIFSFKLTKKEMDDLFCINKDKTYGYTSLRNRDCI